MINESAITSQFIYCPTETTHAQVPTVLALPGCYRIFFASRPQPSTSSIYAIDVDKEDPATIQKIIESPILSPKPGTFYANGIFPASICHDGHQYRLYITGMQHDSASPYYSRMGVAFSADGLHFSSPEMIVVGNATDDAIQLAPWVMLVKRNWHMWYSAGREGDHYELYHATSNDGIYWQRDESAVFTTNVQQISFRASVICHNQQMKMLYCTREKRHNKPGNYQLRYATSDDLKRWQPQQLMLPKSSWDNAMQAYPCLQAEQDRLNLFYAGNDYGKTGMGVMCGLGATV